MTLFCLKIWRNFIQNLELLMIKEKKQRQHQTSFPFILEILVLIARKNGFSYFQLLDF